MKALSIRAPWWWCILHAGKRIENRGDRFPRRYTGPVLLHASKWWSLRLVSEMWTDILADGLLDDVDTSEWSWRRMRDMGGHIVGIADIVEVRPSPCVQSVEHNGAHLEPYETPGGLALVLENVRAFETPVPYKGALGLFLMPWDAENDRLFPDLRGERDALHPTGKCSCFGEGECPWCREWS